MTDVTIHSVNKSPQSTYCRKNTIRSERPDTPGRQMNSNSIDPFVNLVNYKQLA